MELRGDYVFEIKDCFCKKVDQYYAVLFKNNHKYIILNEESIQWFNELKDGKTIGEVFIKFDLGDKNDEYLGFLSDLYWALTKRERSSEKPELAIKYDITYKCNANCVHCFLPGFPKTKELNLEQWKMVSDKILNGLDYKPVLAISGGEALICNEELKQLIDYIRPRVEEITLLTNGFIFSDWIENNNKEDLDYYLKNIDFFQISLDGYDEETYDSIRGKGKFKKVVRTIEYLNSLDRLVSLHTTISNKNMDAVEKHFVDFVTSHNLYRNNINHFSFSVVRALGNGKTMEENDEICTTLEYEKFLSRLQRKINEHYPRKVLENDDILSNTICSVGSQITVSPNGLCYMCGFVSDDPICDMLNDDFEDIKNKFAAFREQLDQKHMKECQECELAGFCFGRCRVNNKLQTGSYTSIKCDDSIKEEFYRSIVREKILGIPY